MNRSMVKKLITKYKKEIPFDILEIKAAYNSEYYTVNYKRSTKTFNDAACFSDLGLSWDRDGVPDNKIKLRLFNGAILDSYRELKITQKIHKKLIPDETIKKWYDYLNSMFGHKIYELDDAAYLVNINLKGFLKKDMVKYTQLLHVLGYTRYLYEVDKPFTVMGAVAMKDKNQNAPFWYCIRAADLLTNLKYQETTYKQSQGHHNFPTNVASMATLRQYMDSLIESDQVSATLVGNLAVNKISNIRYEDVKGKIESTYLTHPNIVITEIAYKANLNFINAKVPDDDYDIWDDEEDDNDN